MNQINFKKIITAEINIAIDTLTKLLAEQGFGVLTRIDFHTKMKEKLNKDIAPVVILGACNPALAYEAYLKNTDVTGLIPCNAVVRDIGGGKLSVELTKPSAMMLMMGEQALADLAKSADEKLLKVLESL